jgi:23S rRNA pseudouridine955/2504/2580 synthase
MSVHGGAGEKGPTLIELLAQAYAIKTTLHLVHRLDRATSGLIVVAKTKEAASALGKSWERAEKTYLALALGVIDRELVIDAPLEDKHGQVKAAHTRARPLSVLGAIEPKTTLLSIALGTGRTHQIRLHLAEAGHPVLLDDKHGDFDANKRWSRAVREACAARGTSRTIKHLMLHSFRLSLEHPRKKSRFLLTSEPPEWWAEAIHAGGGAVDGLHEVP